MCAAECGVVASPFCRPSALVGPTSQMRYRQTPPCNDLALFLHAARCTKAVFDPCSNRSVDYVIAGYPQGEGYSTTLMHSFPVSRLSTANMAGFPVIAGMAWARNRRAGCHHSARMESCIARLLSWSASGPMVLLKLRTRPTHGSADRGSPSSMAFVCRRDGRAVCVIAVQVGKTKLCIHFR